MSKSSAERNCSSGCRRVSCLIGRTRGYHSARRRCPFLSDRRQTVHRGEEPFLGKVSRRLTFSGNLLVEGITAGNNWYSDASLIFILEHFSEIHLDKRKGLNNQCLKLDSSGRYKFTIDWPICCLRSSSSSCSSSLIAIFTLDYSRLLGYFT